MVADGQGSREKENTRLTTQKPAVSFLAGQSVASIGQRCVVQCGCMPGSLKSNKDDGMLLCATSSVVPNRAAHQNHQGALSRWEQPLIAEHLPCALPNLSIPSVQPSEGVICIPILLTWELKLREMKCPRSPRWPEVEAIWIPNRLLTQAFDLFSTLLPKHKSPWSRWSPDPQMPMSLWALVPHKPPLILQAGTSAHKKKSFFLKGGGQVCTDKVNSAADGHPLLCSCSIKYAIASKCKF